MNISCSICAELFRGPDAQSLHVTRCGHVFHNECLSKWLERLNKVRVDVVNLQNENDNLKYRLIEKDGAIKSKENAINKLQEENKILNEGQTKSRKVILTLERKLDQTSIIAREHNNQIETLKARLGEIDHLREKLKEANNKNKTAELVQHLITGSQQETEELLKEGWTITELATMVTTLKRELQNCNAKRSQIRSNSEELAKQLKICKEEKLKLEEKCSILESKLFQLESKNDSKNDSLERISNIENVLDNHSPTEQQTAKRKFGEIPTFTRTKTITLESSKNVSPAMNIKASSIAGLSPLLKRAKSSESHKLSPINDEKPETFSILKKPRLIQHHAKKSELRPIRLNNFQASSNVAGSSSSAQQFPKTLSSGSLSSKMMNLDNRFRLGSLSKPN